MNYGRQYDLYMEAQYNEPEEEQERDEDAWEYKLDWGYDDEEA